MPPQCRSLPATIDLASRQLTARVVNRRAPASTCEPIDGYGVVLGPLDCVQAIVMHSGFLDRLYHGQVRLTATLRAAKGLAPIVDFLKAADAQRGIWGSTATQQRPVRIALQPLGCKSRYAAIGVEGVVAEAYSSLRWFGAGVIERRRFLSMNIKSMTLTELVKIRVKADAEIELRAAADRSRLIDALGSLRSIRGKRNGASHPLAGKKLPPKYRNPKNRNETWAGRGNRPRWLVRALKTGKRLEAFAVK